MADLQHIEKAIRDALAKVDAGDRTTRQRVYASLWTAHERALDANTSLDDSEKDRRREALKKLVANVESEFGTAGSAAQPAQARELDAALRPTSRPAPRPAPRPTARPSSERRAEPAAFGDSGLEDVSAGSRREPSSYPWTAANDAGPVAIPGEERVQAPHRRSYAMRFSLAALLLVVGGGVIWAVYSDVIMSGYGHGATTPPAKLHSEDYAPAGGQAKNRSSARQNKWITVFEPAEATRITVGGTATAEIAKNGDEQFARIGSTSSDGEVRFDVGQGVLDALAGGHAIFDILLQAEGNKPVQVAVRCDFGSLAPCDRKRYNVGITRQDYLLEVDLPLGIHPASGGTIAINPGIAGGGHKVDVYSIRARTAH